MTSGRIALPLRHRLAAHTLKTRRCWIWTGPRNENGYGRITVGSTRDGSRGPKYVHRLVYEGSVGRIPRGKCVLHKCDVPACIRVSHLFLGTQRDNVADMVRKGRNVPRAKITKTDADTIRALYRKGLPQKDIALRFGVGSSNVSAIVRGRSWSQ